jgi:hypothetical protein
MRSGTDDDPYWLFVEGEYAEWVYSGNATYGWGLVDGRIPHVGFIYRNTTSADAHMINGAWTTAKLDTSGYDNAGIVVTASNKMTIRRPNKYHVRGAIGISPSAVNSMLARIKMGAEYCRGLQIFVTNGCILYVANVVGQLAMTIASPDITLEGYHTTGANKDLYGKSGTEYLSFLQACEILL